MNVAAVLIKGMSLRVVSFFTQIVITLVMTPLIVHSLGDRMYGLWTVIGTFLGYYGLLDFGLSSACTRFFSKALGGGDEDELNRVFNTVLALFTMVAFAVIILTGCSIATCQFFISDSTEIALFRKIIAIMGLSLALTFQLRVFEGIIASHLRYDLRAQISILKIVLVNILIYLSLKNGNGILSVAIINFFGTCLELILNFAAAYKITNHITINVKLINKNKIAELFGYSSKTFVGQIADILRFRLDSMVIVYFLNLSLVAPYVIGQRLIEYFTDFIGSLFGILTPVFSKYDGENNTQEIQNKLIEMTKFSVLMSVYVGLTIIIYGKQFIISWMGKNYESSYLIAVILCISYMFALMQNPSVSLLFGISKHKYFVVANSCEGLLNVVLSVILVRPYGIYGVAMGTSISMLTFKLFVQPVYVCKIIDIKLKRYYSECLLIPALKTLAVMAIAWSLQYYIKLQDLSAIGICVITQTIVILPILGRIVISEEYINKIKVAILAKSG
jgi:O-antigen/teichoic acid export membrane protein